MRHRLVVVLTLLPLVLGAVPVVTSGASAAAAPGSRGLPGTPRHVTTEASVSTLGQQRQTVSWKAPARGTGPVRGYHVDVTCQDPVVVSSFGRSFSSERREWTFRVHGPVRCVAKVTARNRRGSSAPARIAFVVPRAPRPVTPVDRNPVSTLTTSASGFGDIDDVAVAADGTSYVLVDSRVAVYAPGARDDAAPTRTLTIPETDADRAAFIAVDAGGYLTAVSLPFGDGGAVRVLDPAGEVVTTRSFADLGLEQPVALTAVGDEVAVVDGGSDGVEVFDLYGEDAGDAPTRSLLGGATTRLVGPTLIASAAGRLAVSGSYVDDGEHVPWVAVFAPGADGEVAPRRYLEGASTGLQDVPTGLAIDAAGGIFVGSSLLDGDNLRRSRIFRFAPTANGPRARALAALGGSVSGLGDATSLRLLPGSALATYSSLYRHGIQVQPDAVARTHSFAEPGRIVGLTVGGTDGAARRTVTWEPGSSYAGVPVPYFSVEYQCGGGGEHLGGGGYGGPELSPFTIELGALRRGRCSVRVTGGNGLGQGPTTTTEFTVRR